MEAAKASHDLALKVPKCHFQYLLLVKQVTKAAQIQDEWRNKLDL